jgi:hypothetical protein
VVADEVEDAAGAAAGAQPLRGLGQQVGGLEGEVGQFAAETALVRAPFAPEAGAVGAKFRRAGRDHGVEVVKGLFDAETVVDRGRAIVADGRGGEAAQRVAEPASAFEVAVRRDRVESGLRGPLPQPGAGGEGVVQAVLVGPDGVREPDRARLGGVEVRDFA